jgi:hypothetical protein
VGINTSINIVPHEEIVGVGDIASNLKQLHQIVELPMDVPADNNGRSHLYNIELLIENFFGLC